MANMSVQEEKSVNASASLDTQFPRKPVVPHDFGNHGCSLRSDIRFRASCTEADDGDDTDVMNHIFCWSLQVYPTSYDRSCSSGFKPVLNHSAAVSQSPRVKISPSQTGAPLTCRRESCPSPLSLFSQEEHSIRVVMDVIGEMCCREHFCQLLKLRTLTLLLDDVRWNERVIVCIQSFPFVQCNMECAVLELLLRLDEICVPLTSFRARNS